MNAEDLKAALMHALNHDQADPFLQSVDDLVCSLSGDLETIESAVFDFSLEVRRTKMAYRQHMKEMADYRQESEAYARAEAAQQAAEDRIRSGKFTDEESDYEALEAYRHRPRKAA